MDKSSPRAYSLPVVPLKDGALFPLQLMPLSVGRPRSVAAMRAAVESEDKSLVIVAQREFNDA
jgi:ATP-dependent Lon protease